MAVGRVNIGGSSGKSLVERLPNWDPYPVGEQTGTLSYVINREIYVGTKNVGSSSPWTYQVNVFDKTGNLKKTFNIVTSTPNLYILTDSLGAGDFKNYDYDDNQLFTRASETPEAHLKKRVLTSGWSFFKVYDESRNLLQTYTPTNTHMEAGLTANVNFILNDDVYVGMYASGQVRSQWTMILYGKHLEKMKEFRGNAKSHMI